MLPAVKHYPITVKLYHFMAEEGFFTPDERVELIGGEIVEKSPVGSTHASCVNFLNEFLTSLFRGQYQVSIQNPVILDDESEPQPDIALLRYKKDFYKDSLPAASDAALLIEVADKTVDFDRSRKLPRYGAAGVPETWLVDLPGEKVEVHFAPKKTTYGMVKIYQRGEDVISETMPNLKISVDELLG